MIQIFDSAASRFAEWSPALLHTHPRVSSNSQLTIQGNHRPVAMFVPWQLGTITRHRDELQKLLAASLLPEHPEESLGNPIMTQIHQSLQPSSPCRVCQLLFSLVRDSSTPMGFFEDYACLCFFCLYAPHCWTSTMAAAADLCEIMHLHFPEEEATYGLFGPGRLMGIDLQLHFFVQKCFKTTAAEKILGISNLQFLKSEFIRGMLTGTITCNFCFKTSWPRTDKEEATGPTPCCQITDTTTTPASGIPELARATFCGASRPTKPSLLPALIDIWSTSSELLDEPRPRLIASDMSELKSVVASHDPFFSPPLQADTSQGPCLMHPTLGLRYKNGTASVCLLCECLAAHPEAPKALQTLQCEVMGHIENNVKLVDRIAFVLDNPFAMPYVSDPLLRELIRGCTPQEIHKHLFCDPLCALNAKVVSEDVLFRLPREQEYKKLRASAAAGQLLDANTLFDCEVVQTLVFLFKGLQNARVGKTTSLDIIRELTAQLKRHRLDLAHPSQTSHLYA